MAVRAVPAKRLLDVRFNGNPEAARRPRMSAMPECFARTVEEERDCLINSIRTQFEVEVWRRDPFPKEVCRTDVSVHTIRRFLPPELTETEKQEMRRWVESRSWQLSRQFWKADWHPSITEYIYLAPMILVNLDVGFHVTRIQSIPLIMEVGLLPSSPDRQTTQDRADCEGNIYLCNSLGTCNDSNVCGTLSAHWWRAHLAKVNRFSDPDWANVEVKIAAGGLPPRFLIPWSPLSPLRPWRTSQLCVI